MKEITFTVPGKPTAWQRRVHTKRGASYMPKQTVQAEEAVAWAFAEQAGSGFTPHTGPVELVIEARWRHPKSPQWRRDAAESEGWPRPKRPDEDNIGKLVSDGLQGVAYDDDGQVVRKVTRKVYHPRNEMVVTVRLLEANPRLKKDYEEAEDE